VRRRGHRAGNLCAELDLAWAYVAGVDPAAYIRKFKGRCPVVHAKDVVKAKEGRKQAFKPLGQGELNWPDIFAAGDEAGIEWYVYEQDSGEGSPFDFTHASYEFLVKQMK
jgi:sugar phosphate isomerase/epimerase